MKLRVAHEADDPDAFVDFFYAETLTGQNGRDIDFLAENADAAAMGDDYLAIVEGISQVRQHGIKF